MRPRINSMLSFFVPLIIFGLFIFWPTFNLHMVGDDYLGLWRYHYYLDGYVHTQHWNNFNFFFTDYGPQDTFTAIIHNFFGWTPQYYYGASFFLRMLAATSIYFLVRFLTKKTYPGVIAGFYFAATATGLEATDWSFNMPSYLAISLLCWYLLTYFHALKTNNKLLWILTFALFYITIISQPIRMTFLPLCMVLIEAYNIITKRTKATFLASLLRIGIFITIFVGIFVTGFLGNSIGAGETLQVRLHGGWRAIGNNFSALLPLLKQGLYSVLLLPVAQFGKLFIPDSLIPSAYQSLTNIKLLKITIPLLFVFVAIIFTPLSLSWKKYRNNLGYTKYIFLGIATLWSALVWVTYGINHQLSFNKTQYLVMNAGGLMLLALGYFFITANKKSNVRLALLLGTIIAILPFITPWLREPASLFESTGRYLIVPASGAAILLGVLASIPQKAIYQKIVYIFLGAFILFHANVTHGFFSHMETVRGIAMTDAIRKSVPHVRNFGGKEPLVFYFEPAGSEILHHALLFGFPVIMGDQYNFFNVWNMMYTDNWDEVTQAYQNGSSLKRFGISLNPVKITNIYSFRLDGTSLVDTTQQTRDRLVSLQETQK